jgi:RND family efflux transporter MFP subunit
MKTSERPEHTTDGAAAAPGPSLRRAASWGLLVFALLLVAGILPRVVRQKDLTAAAAQTDAVPIVLVGTAHRAPSSTDLTLPGTVQALRETTIFARTNGYVKRWLVDIGSPVRAGQMLAEIETPDLDQELAQARATREQVQANLELTKATLARWTQLVQQDAATKQELDEKRAAFNAAQASANASEANVQRLTALHAFGAVTAPFAGTITQRNLEVGALISAGGGAGSRPLFAIAQADTVLIYVNVPEESAAGMHGGETADVTLADQPALVWHARVAHVARALDATSRTMLTQLELPNPDHALMPGMFVNVRVKTDRSTPPMMIPANALLLRSEGPEVAIVGEGGRVHMQKIELGRDYGDEVEVVSGLDGESTLVINPGDDVVEGTVVRPAEPVKGKPGKT